MKSFQSSYSASRAALLQAETEFRQRRQAFINDFLNPVYENFMIEAVALGRIEAEGFFEDPVRRRQWLQADWYGESSKILDPVKEVQGSLMKIMLGLSTHRREAAELTGSDYDDNIEILEREYKMRSEKIPGVPENPNFPIGVEEDVADV